MDEQDKKVFEIVKEVERAEAKSASNLITLSSGVVLKTKPVPPMILSKIDQKFPDPPVPTVRDEERGRDILNPSDPNYLKALERNQEAKGTAIIDVISGMGTTLHSIPEGIYPPDSDDWIEPLEYFGLEIPRTGTGRYLAWLKYYIIKSGEDLALIARRSAKALGVPEEEVATAIANFQGNAESGTDSGSATEVSA